MEVTHSIERKQIKAIHTIKLQIQQKLKPYTLAKLEMKTTYSANDFINTLFCTYNYCKVWNRRQSNPTYTHRISSYQHLGHDNNNILLVVGLTMTYYPLYLWPVQFIFAKIQFANVLKIFCIKKMCAKKFMHALIALVSSRVHNKSEGESI